MYLCIKTVSEKPGTVLKTGDGFNYLFRQEELKMAEDFLGYGGRLDEEFVHAENKSIKTEPFEKFEVRAAFEKPELLDGLVRLKTAMGEADFEKYINPLENINISGSSLLILAGAEKLRTALVSRWLPVIKAAFNVVNVRVVGGGRGGVDAY